MLLMIAGVILVLWMVQRYTHRRPFEELQRLPTPLSAILGQRAV